MSHSAGHDNGNSAIPAHGPDAQDPYAVLGALGSLVSSTAANSEPSANTGVSPRRLRHPCVQLMLIFDGMIYARLASADISNIDAYAEFRQTMLRQLGSWPRGLDQRASRAACSRDLVVGLGGNASAQETYIATRLAAFETLPKWLQREIEDSFTTWLRGVNYKGMFRGNIHWDHTQIPDQLRKQPLSKFLELSNLDSILSIGVGQALFDRIAEQQFEHRRFLDLGRGTRIAEVWLSTSPVHDTPVSEHGRKWMRQILDLITKGLIIEDFLDHLGIPASDETKARLTRMCGQPWDLLRSELGQRLLVVATAVSKGRLSVLESGSFLDRNLHTPPTTLYTQFFPPPAPSTNAAKKPKTARSLPPEVDAILSSREVFLAKREAFQASLLTKLTGGGIQMSASELRTTMRQLFAIVKRGLASESDVLERVGSASTPREIQAAIANIRHSAKLRLSEAAARSPALHLKSDLSSTGSASAQTAERKLNVTAADYRSVAEFVAALPRDFARIAETRIKRIQDCSYFGDHKRLWSSDASAALFELRFIGANMRVYYGRSGDTVILLGAGTKKDQLRRIESYTQRLRSHLQSANK